MRVESRTDKELTDKAQAQAAQSWAANVKQVRVTAGRGGGWLQVGVQWKSTLKPHGHGCLDRSQICLSQTF